MPHDITQHPNASLTPRGRRKMVRVVIDHGWTIEAAAERFQVDAKTVTKWRDRFLAEGEAGLFDRSSRPALGVRKHPFVELLSAFVEVPVNLAEEGAVSGVLDAIEVSEQ